MILDSLRSAVIVDTNPLLELEVVFRFQFVRFLSTSRPRLGMIASPLVYVIG